jgi:Domain of unknown function (DUF3336)
MGCSPRLAVEKQVCLKSNFAGVEGFRLYSETYYGSKHLVEEYVEEGQSDGF